MNQTEAPAIASEASPAVLYTATTYVSSCACGFETSPHEEHKAAAGFLLSHLEAEKCPPVMFHGGVRRGRTVSVVTKTIVGLRAGDAVSTRQEAR